MFEPQPMHFAAPLLSDDLVAIVDDIENFFRHRSDAQFESHANN